MWWLDPGKEVLNVLFNRILAPYVLNLDMNQVNYGIGQGQVTLHKLQLKKGALDKFRLPVDVLEGHLGKFTLSLHWMNLGNQPVEVIIEDVYLLVVPSPQGDEDPEEEENRIQAAKMERLENAELLHMRGQTVVSEEDSQKSQGLLSSLITKIVNNLQVTVKNVHIRYEDKLSVPGHPFAVGITLAAFTAISTDGNWQPAFIDSTAGAVHKLAKLQSLAVYFDTDSTSMAGLPYTETVEKFTALISKANNKPDHQFILKPVSGEGRIVINHKLDKITPRFDVQLLFDEIGVLLDNHQYRDIISLIDMYHFYTRQHQYHKYRPSPEELQANKARALIRFAGTAILSEVRERRHKWTWTHFAQRRNDRHQYVDLFRAKLLDTASQSDLDNLGVLEKRLSYQDIRFYRSIARSHARKHMVAQQQLEEEKKKQQSQATSGWTSWLWGSSEQEKHAEEPAFTGEMTDEQRKQLYEVLDYDERAALAESFQAPRDAVNLKLSSKLDKGSFALRADPYGSGSEILSLAFDVFAADFIQRPDSFDASISLGSFAVYDGTTKDTLYPQIVHVKEGQRNGDTTDSERLREDNVKFDDPFFYAKFESNPLDERADNALTVRMRHMEVIYHKGYVEAVYNFFKPPDSQLESVEALLDAASQTLEGIRKETRAGLEHALEKHKTIDVQMDLNAPLIIVPEAITTTKCKHLLIDAGHIAIESNLADKNVTRQIRLKRNQQYGEDDYRRLESMMYDKFSLRLESAQFVIGDELQACRDALVSEEHDSLHLLERVNINLEVQNSIVPTAYRLARFKVSADLPTLHVNMSDEKYKSLMRLVDVSIPNFDGDDPHDTSGSRAAIEVPYSVRSANFPLSAGLFALKETPYTIDDDDNVDKLVESAEAQFFEADEGHGSKRPQLQQHIFELNFCVSRLRAALSKSSPDGRDRQLGDVTFEHFSLAFALAKFDMSVDVNLRSLSMNICQPNSDVIEFMSSAGSDSQDEDLLIVKYKRVQKASPFYESEFEGIDQTVDIQVSTFVFRVAPEPILTLYDFIMTTFVSTPNETVTIIDVDDNHKGNVSVVTVMPENETSAQKIRVTVDLASVQVVLLNENIRIGTLSLSTANMAVLLRANTMRVTARLGRLSLVDDSDIKTVSPEFKHIMSIEGDNLAEFAYQTFDPSEDIYAGIKSKVFLSAGSVKFNFLEQPLHDIYLFVTKLARLKGVYDAATQAAAQRASEIEKMQFDVTIKTPIIVFPSDPAKTLDKLTMRLGEFVARNSYENLANKVTASLRGIQLSSEFQIDNKLSTLRIIDDIDITADVIQNSGIDRNRDIDYPDVQISVNMSDVKLHLTQVQFIVLMNLSQSILRVLEGDSQGVAQSKETTSLGPPSGPQLSEISLKLSTDLQPELQGSSSAKGLSSWAKLDLVVAIGAIKLHLYDQFATESNVADHGIARFALNGNTLRLKMLTDGSYEAQVVLRSFTMSNTQKGNSKFREIIPAAQHERNQVMVLYTASGGSSPSSLAIITVDSPQIIVAFDPMFAILDFIMSPFSHSSSSVVAADDYRATVPQNAESTSQSSGINFRFDLHDVAVSVLENESNADSRAICLTIKQLSVSQQGVMALTVSNLGMSLMRMGKASEDVRFLDEIDLTFSMDSRSSSSQQMVSMEINAQPIIFRVSYRDINLITNITNKAVELYGNSMNARSADSPQPDATTGQAVVRSQKSSRLTLQSKKSSRGVGRAHLVTTKEQLKGSFGGLRVVLIGDIHEQPMLHLKVKPFIISVMDWSGELHATTTLATHISYWNLTNSHWEPLIDPWTFTTSVSKEDGTGGTTMTLSAREHLNLNISTTFVELALTTFTMWTQEKDRVLNQARGSYAPYRIRNRTGSPINVWSDIEGSESKDSAPTKILNNQTVEWRFDDWRTMREHVSSAGHNSIGIQFPEQAWEQLRSVPVDREGEYTFLLRPRTDNVSHRLLCEIQVQDNVKLVTLRSTYRVQNQTLYPIELTLVDDKGRPVYSLEKIAPGHDYALPIEAVVKNRIRIQPDQGFGYRWSAPIRWEDLIAKKSFTVRCNHTDEKEAAFRFHAYVQTDLSDPISRKYPKINFKLRAPIELENLLPFDLQYRIYDKNTDQNWKSYLRKGGIMPVHSVELGHLVLLNVTVQDSPFQPSDFAIINTDGHSDFDVENSLFLRDAKSGKLQLKLNYVRYPDAGGAFKVQVYSPYLVINKTGLPFYIKSTRSTRPGFTQDIAGETNPDVLSTPTPFMLSHPNDRGSEFVFKIGNSMWSKYVSLEAPAAEIKLVIPADSHKAEEIHAGLSWTEGLGKYKLTKVITIAPRFLIINNMPDAISFREHGVGPRGRSTIEPGEKCPLHFMRVGDEKLLTVTYPGLNAKWSPPINIEDIGKVAFRLSSSATTESEHLIEADVKIEGSTIFIYLSRSQNGWPFKFENGSAYKISFTQVDQKHFDSDSSIKPYPSYTLLPGEEMDYAWDYPAAKEKKILLVINEARRALDIMEIGNLVPFRFNDTKGVRAVSLDVRADGHTQILQVTNYNPESSVYRPRHRDSISITRHESAASSQEAFEAVTEETPPTLAFNLDLEGVGISLINKKLLEVVYISANALKFEYTSSPVAQSVTLSCGSFQIDNQLHEAIYPVVLQPTPITKESSGVASLPTIQGSVIWLNDQAHGVVFIKYCSILLQALTIEADEDFLFSVYDLTKIQGASWDSGETDVLIQYPDTIPEPPHHAEAGQDLYFEVLELQPIRLTLSFVRTERVSSEDKLSIRNPLAVILNALTMAVGNVNDASLEMNALAIKDMRLTMPDLQARIMYHYRQEVLRQLYRILGSADFIGNPVGLFTNVSSGVADIFYEPFNGVVMHGNKELGIGIAKGAASFVKKTVFGFSDSFTKFTSSVGKGLSAATFDEEYQNRRRMAQRRNKPRHAIYGVASGAEALATSVASGVEGIIMKPIEGAESEGALGFFKGVGKGLVGVVTKPVVGVFDLASNLSEGIRNTTTVFDAPDRDRVRLPRNTPADGVLVPYDARGAIGQSFMKDLDNGAYRAESYVAHINLPGGDNIVLLTASRVISFLSRKLTIDWELPFTHVQGVTTEDTGIRFAHKAGKEHDKFVYIPDKSSQTWFFGQIASVVKSFNARRRMD